MAPQEHNPARKLSILLTAIFLVSMFMGSGPGLHLINPDPTDPNAVFTFLGLPKIYAWGLLWYAVQLTVILIAYFKIWTADDGTEEIPSQVNK